MTIVVVRKTMFTPVCLILLYEKRKRGNLPSSIQQKIRQIKTHAARCHVGIDSKNSRKDSMLEFQQKTEEIKLSEWPGQWRCAKRKD
jgi:hypothetical protein